jgi:hypothetical protein
VSGTFVEGHSRPKGKHQHSDDEAPEINLAAVPQRVIVIRRPLRAIQTVEKQKRVSGIDNGMDTLAQHSGTARPGGRAELCCGNEKIVGNCRIDHLSR